ncbi:MAG: hypothetical protein KIT09_29620 [Bryobacteraceae bacterium]|nr:hypothetical protein [Bryobacteraceae bacterium]
MSTSVELPRPQQTWSPPAATPLDEAVWQAWVATGRAQERRSSATRFRAVKWASIAVLLGAAGLWSNFAPFEVLVRFLVTASALVLMFQAFQTKHYPVAATFGALALLFNPVALLLEFSGGWQRAVVVASAAPFVASLLWPKGRNRRMESNG